MVLMSVSVAMSVRVFVSMTMGMSVSVCVAVRRVITPVSMPFFIVQLRGRFGLSTESKTVLAITIVLIECRHIDICEGRMFLMMSFDVMPIGFGIATESEHIAHFPSQLFFVIASIIPAEDFPNAFSILTHNTFLLQVWTRIYIRDDDCSICESDWKLMFNCCG